MKNQKEEGLEVLLPLCSRFIRDGTCTVIYRGASTQSVNKSIAVACCRLPSSLLASPVAKLVMMVMSIRSVKTTGVHRGAAVADLLIVKHPLGVREI